MGKFACGSSIIRYTKKKLNENMCKGRCMVIE